LSCQGANFDLLPDVLCQKRAVGPEFFRTEPLNSVQRIPSALDAIAVDDQ
jgi:hypothetical protein